jgi:hypothetical protein
MTAADAVDAAWARVHAVLTDAGFAVTTARPTAVGTFQIALYPGDPAFRFLQLAGHIDVAVDVVLYAPSTYPLQALTANAASASSALIAAGIRPGLPERFIANPDVGVVSLTIPTILREEIQ